MGIMPWIIAGLLIVIGIIIFFGKGLWLIAGYNTASQKKSKFNKNRLGKVCGTGIILIGTGLSLFNYYNYELPKCLEWIIPWGIFAVVIAIVILVNNLL